MKRLKPTDVVIIGSGFAGLVMAKEIATRTALNVIVLERGPARSLDNTWRIWTKLTPSEWG